MPQCFVSSCSNYYGKTRNNTKIIYHMLPTAPGMVSKWTSVCRENGDKPPPHARVCSAHFSDKCYRRDLQHELLGLPLRKKLKKDAIPDLNLPVKGSKSRKEVLKTMDTQNQIKERKVQKVQSNIQELKIKAKLDSLRKIRPKVSINNDLNENKVIKPKPTNKKQQVTVIDITTMEPVVNKCKKKLPNLTLVTKLNLIPIQTMSVTDVDMINNLRKNGTTIQLEPKIPVESSDTQEIKTNKNQTEVDNKNSDIKKEVIPVEKNKDNNSKPKSRSLSGNDNTELDTDTEISANKSAESVDKNNEKYIKRPMRSSIRIAKKKSIECLSDSFTEKINNKRDGKKRERFSDKLKFMAKLQLKHEKNNHSVIDLDQFFDNFVQDDKSLNKMQIMDNVVEGCPIQPSSPGHAKERTEDISITTEAKLETPDDKPSNNIDSIQGEILTETNKIENISNGIKEEPDSSDVHDETYSNISSPKAENLKRKSESEEYPIKRLKAEIRENFMARDKIINDFIEMADCNNLDQINSFSEQLLIEIKTLNEFAKEKEREWNNILHLKKLKEELLLRMQRKKQILVINEKSDYADLMNEPQNLTLEERIRNNLPQSVLKSNIAHANKPYGANINGNLRQNHLSPKTQNNFDLNGPLDKQGKRLTLDVQSIIADYRQRHPESVPRRGRRIRCTQSDGLKKFSNSIINFSSMTLGSGAQVRQGDVSNDLGFILNTINTRQEAGKKNSDSSGTNSQDTVSFKDMLLQFAKLSQNERNELIQNAIKPPPPYPEVTVHPIPTSTPPPPPPSQNNSLLHGILTKTPAKQNSKTTYSPTLARLLTAPERGVNNQAMMTSSPIANQTVHPSNMSISEILSTSKACNEITITPVETTYESNPLKEKSLEDETEDSADRLVIDENNESDLKKQSNSDNNSDGGDDVPICQGCNQKPAQFVCAGCGNQWYCSRDCQVHAWDEHSELCSG